MSKRGVNIEDVEFHLLLEAIFQVYDHDFRGYALASLKRRATQALAKFECATFSALQDRVLREPETMRRLLPLFTIGVSDLFRDPDYFRKIREDVVPHLQTYPSLKVWVAGCSTGEELYSLVILFREAGLERRTVFYATDINNEALAIAEAGAYAMDRVAGFTQNHQRSGGTCSLSDYYTAQYDRALFQRTLRDRVVFSKHSLVSDAVFAEMNLVSCRNVLIYFERSLQDRAIGLFRDSLMPGGFLGLGSRESLRFSTHDDAFSEFSREQRLFRRVAA